MDYLEYAYRKADEAEDALYQARLRRDYATKACESAEEVVAYATECLEIAMQAHAILQERKDELADELAN